LPIASCPGHGKNRGRDHNEGNRREETRTVQLANSTRHLVAGKRDFMELVLVPSDEMKVMPDVMLMFIVRIDR
jgi:hypothetical protein